MIKIERFTVGGIMETNCYLVINTKDDIALLIDTGAKSFELEKRIDEFGTEKIKYILLTHGHFDHIGYTAEMKEKCQNAKIVISETDKSFIDNDSLNLSFQVNMKIKHFQADILVFDKQKLDFGSEKIQVITTAGHTGGSVCYIIGNNIFTGDTLMAGSMGRTDFPTGNVMEMDRSLKKLANIKENLNVYSGHGNNSTLDYERKHNVFMGNLSYDNLY